MRNRLVWTSLLVLAFALLGGAAPAGPRPAARKKAAPQKKAASKERVFRTSAPPVGARLGDVWVNPIDNGKMVYVPAGEFTLGLSEAQIRVWLRKHPADKGEWFAKEQPHCRVTLQGYWMDKYEVTNSQYLRFVRATGRLAPTHWKEGQVPSGMGSFPVVNVSWYDAAAYAEWASERLPSELEWEKAARGTDGRLFPWGNQWDAKKCRNLELITGKAISDLRQGVTAFMRWADNHDSEREGPKPVGSYPAGASPYGCQDMAGNAWEWCADWYDESAYQGYAKGDLTPPAAGTQKVWRGASWHWGNPWHFRCTCRSLANFPDTSNGPVGFRCSRGPV